LEREEVVRLLEQGDRFESILRELLDLDRVTLGLTMLLRNAIAMPSFRFEASYAASTAY
jgi:hypothetical protein